MEEGYSHGREFTAMELAGLVHHQNKKMRSFFPNKELERVWFCIVVTYTDQKEIQQEDMYEVRVNRRIRNGNYESVRIVILICMLSHIPILICCIIHYIYVPTMHIHKFGWSWDVSRMLEMSKLQE